MQRGAAATGRRISNTEPLPFPSLSLVSPASARERYADSGPRAGPCDAVVLTKRPRVNVAAQTAIAFVVDLRVSGAPYDIDGEIGCQAEAHRRAQALGPGADGSQRSLRPVLFADQPGELSRGGEEISVVR